MTWKTALLATGPLTKDLMQIFDCFFVVSPNKLFHKQPICRWFRRNDACCFNNVETSHHWQRLIKIPTIPWWHRDMKTIAALLTVNGGIHYSLVMDPHHKRSVMRTLFDLCLISLNKLLNQQASCQQSEKPQCPCDVKRGGSTAEWSTDPQNKNRHFDYFVDIGGIVSCQNDCLRCHQWWQSCRIDNLFF